MKKLEMALCALSAGLLLTAGCSQTAAEIRIEKFSSYSSEYRGVEAKITAPVISGLSIPKLEEELNAEFSGKALKLTEQYTTEALKLLADKSTEDGHLGYEMGYEIPVNNEKVLVLDLWQMNIAGSSSTTHNFYTFDKAAGTQITLKSLFNGKADYIRVLSDQVRSEIRKHMKKESGAVYWLAPEMPEGFSSIKPDQNFYLNDKGNIVICFDKYEIAPGSMGSPQFEISRRAIAPYLAPLPKKK